MGGLFSGFLLCLLIGFALVKEGVAGIPETFPDGIRLFIWHAANGLPLFLKLDQFLFGFLKIRVVLQALSIFTHVALELQIFLLLIIQRLEESILGLKKRLVSTPELLVD